MTTLTTAELDQLTAMRAQARLDAFAGIKSYYLVYQTLADWMTNRYGVSPTDPVVLWLRGATEVNAERGALSELIRSYTEAQYKLRYGTGIPAGMMQAASNKVAEYMLRDLLGESVDGWPLGQIPDITRIALVDATAVGEVLFNVDGDTSAPPTNSAWSGTLLFSLLRSDQTAGLTSTGTAGALDTLNDLRDVLFSFFAYRQGLQAAWTAYWASSELQKDRDFQLLDQTITGYLLSANDPLNLKNALVSASANTAMTGHFRLIADVGANVFLDMILGAVQGKSLIGTTTTDAAFSASVNVFFGALSPAQLQALQVKLLPTDGASLANLAASDVNVRAALGALSIVSVQVASNVAEKFSMYDPATGLGHITSSWIADRAAMTDWLVVRSRTGATGAITGAMAGRTIAEALNYEQRGDGSTLATQILVGSVDEMNQRRHVIFGGASADMIDGFGRADHLYGGAGNDTLNGQGGADYLEGNADNDTLDGGDGNDTLLGGTGLDTYHFNTDFGRDLVIDQDGTGAIRWNGNPLPQGLKVFDGIWQSADRQVAYTLVADAAPGRQDLVISFTASKNRIIVRGWDQNTRNLGINFGADMARPTAGTNYIGDFKKKNDGTYYEISAGNYVFDGVEQNAADQITGGIGNDALYGLGGNDALLGRGGDDYIDGGAGVDVLQGGLGRDWLLGGDGADFIYGSSQGSLSNPVRVDFVPPTNTLPILIGRGFNWLAAGQPTPEGWIDSYVSSLVGRDDGEGDVANYLDAGIGDDFVAAGQSHDIAQAGAGEDKVYGMAGNDVLVGGAGADFVLGDGPVGPDDPSVVDAPGSLHGADVIVGGSGNDRLLGQGSDDLLFGGADDDRMWGDDGDTTSTPAEFHGSDQIFGGGGNDEIYGGGRDDEIDGDDGNDLLWGDDTQAALDAAAHGNDIVRGGAGDDSVAGAGGDDKLYGGDGADALWGDATAELLAEAHHGNDYIDGGAGNDHLYGGAGDDVLAGGAGDDELLGEAGNDTLQGGLGVDVLAGGAGDDTYIVGAGDSVTNALGYSESIHDNIGKNTIVLAGYTAASVIVRTDGSGQIAVDGTATERVVIVGGAGSSGNTYRFGDGATYSYSGLVGNFSDVVISGTDALGNTHALGGKDNDTLTASFGSATISGGRGNDKINGSGGGNTYLYALGDGRDSVTDSSTQASSRVVFDTGIAAADLRLSGAAGSFTVNVGTSLDDSITLGGFDQRSSGAQPKVASFVFADGSSLTYSQLVARGFDGTAGHDTISGTAGGDRIDGHGGNDVLTGGQGSDTLLGGTKADDLSGDDGADTLDGGLDDDILRGGNGADTYLFGAGSGSDTVFNADSDAAGMQPDVVRLGAGVTTGGVRLTRDQNDLVLGLAGSADTLRVKDFMLQDGLSSSAIDFIEFADSTRWGLAAIKAFALSASTGKDTLIGYASGDAISGGGSDDTLDGNDGGDTLSGGIGRDVLRGGAGNDALEGNEGDDSLFGDAGSDYLNGGSGDDALAGGDGADTYVFGRGSGRDRVDNLDTDAPGAQGDTVLFAADVAPAQITLSRHGSANDLYIGITGAADTLKLQGFFELNGTGAKTVENLRFADSTVWAFADVQARTVVLADDLSVYQSGSSPLIGGAGDDRLFGSGGNDTLDGGTGSDYLNGNTGSDTYLFGRGSGVDEVSDPAGTSDMIQLGSGVLVTDLILAREGTQLVLSIAGAPDRLRISGYYPLDRDALVDTVERIRFADTTVWDAAAIASHVAAAPPATEGNDVLFGPANATSVFAGLGGDDYLSGGSLGDNLDGGSGQDDLYGSGGDDILMGGADSDVLNGGAGKDVVDGGAGDDSLRGGADDDTLDGGPGNDTLMPDRGNNRIAFGRGYGRDQISGPADSPTANTIVLGAGIGASDVLVSYDGIRIRETSDVLLFTDGIGRIEFADGSWWDAAQLAALRQSGTDDSDTMMGHPSLSIADHLTGLAGDDLLQGYYGHDTLDGGDGADLVYGSYGNDALSGGSQSDRLFGDSGNDWLAGGRGDDTLTGGAGSDVYAYEFGGGFDIIESERYSERAGEIDSLRLGPGIDASTLRLGAGWFVSGGALPYTDPSYLLITGIGPGGGVAVHDFYGLFEADSPLQEIEFDSGAVWGSTLIKGLVGAAVANGGAGNDQLVGTSTPARLSGQGGDDQLTGGPGNDWLDGGAGSDAMAGGAGNDTYLVDSTADLVQEAANGGVDTVQSAVTMSLGEHLERLRLIGPAAINGTGNAGNNELIGNAGQNVLNGREGADTLAGRNGDDTFIVENPGDTIIELSEGGFDTVESSISWTLSALEFSVVLSEVEALVLTGAAPINGTGNELSNTIVGNAAANRLDGSYGHDTMAGGTGDDTYVVEAAQDAVVEESGAGFDSVEASVSWAMSTNVERLILVGYGDISATGSVDDNTLIGNGGANRLDGGAGIDSMTGGAGNDTYVVDSIGDTAVEAAGGGSDTVESSIAWVLGGELENLTLTGASSINGTGNGLANTLRGNAANNTLIGGAGNDTMLGGAGNDIYVVDATTDVLVENSGEGTDTVESALSWALGANLENLLLSGTGAINGTGNALSNIINGNTGANVLNGGAGNDTLAGSAGNDTYVVDSAGDTAVEAASAGTDLVQSGVTWTLGANLENLTLTGAAAINATGNDLNNQLVGNVGNNVLDGGMGNDNMAGGAGNDTYVVNASADVVTEAASAGTDTVQASIAWTLAGNFENLTLTGTSAINGTGNTLNNLLRGNAAANVLSGGTGSDSMLGGAGNDTYVIDATGDSVNELANEGLDLVQSSITHTLAANVENLALAGSTAINGTGNTLDNMLTGNSANNTLTGGSGNDFIDGGIGNDTMVGGAGNDTYVFNVTTDVVTELANEGSDTVRSGVTLTLGSNIENLVLTGALAISGTGNVLHNTMSGNTANNTLTGAAGNDTLDGAVGADVLVGGSGADTYLFGRGWGLDTVQENDTTAAVLDRVVLGAGIAQADTTFARIGNNLQMSIANSSDKLVVQNWYLGSQYQVERFQYADGTSLTNAQVAGLVGAMAAFGGRAAANTTPTMRTTQWHKADLVAALL